MPCCCCIDCARLCAPRRSASSARPCEFDRAVGIAVAELAFRVAHVFAGAAELLHLFLARLAGLPQATLAQLLEQLVELLAQRLLLIAQLAHALLALPLLAFLALLAGLLALLALLTLLAFLTALAALPLLAALVLALLEGAVAQLLLAADHVAELVERLSSSRRRRRRPAGPAAPSAGC